MIDAAEFVDAARQRGYRLWSGVPCSYLQPLINYVIGSDTVHYISAANEGDAVAIGAGAELGGIRSIVIFQNSGLGNAISPLTSLNHVFKLPLLLIVTLRGEPGGPPDEPQHSLMGTITTCMLDIMNIPWEFFPTDSVGIAASLERADMFASAHGRPYALVMRKDSVKACQLGRSNIPHRATCQPADARTTASFQRHEFLHALQQHGNPEDIYVATTGYTGRELYALGDRPNQFYMVGSMGCAASFGLGLALAQKRRRVIILDGDGAALMRLGALASIGREAPPNLTHIIFSNGIHESTGGQDIANGAADFPMIAAALGYPASGRATSPSDLMEQLAMTRETCLIEIPVLPGTLQKLPRPEITPPQVAARLRTLLAGVHPE